MQDDNTDKRIFCGREEEMSALQELWRKVANSEKPEPQLGVILGEPGLGKTRLVQEFFNWLSTHYDDVDGEGYWPDTLAQNNKNLEVNPSLNECDNSHPLPFLWWGVRLTDPGSHNAISSSTVSADIMQLTPHLAPMYVAQREKERTAKGLKTVLSEGVGAIPIIGEIVSAGNALFELYGLLQEERGEEINSNLNENQQKEQKSIIERLINDLELLVYEGKKSKTPVP